jgi:hypothetical protein
MFGILILHTVYDSFNVSRISPNSTAGSCKETLPVQTLPALPSLLPDLYLPSILSPKHTGQRQLRARRVVVRRAPFSSSSQAVWAPQPLHPGPVLLPCGPRVRPALNHLCTAAAPAPGFSTVGAAASGFSTHSGAQRQHTPSTAAVPAAGFSTPAGQQQHTLSTAAAPAQGFSTPAGQRRQASLSTAAVPGGHMPHLQTVTSEFLSPEELPPGTHLHLIVLNYILPQQTAQLWHRG